MNKIGANKIVPFEYIINEKKRTVVYAVKSHGQMFIGKASCMESDNFDVETGKAIAHMRAILEQRKFDLEMTRSFIRAVKDQYENAMFCDGFASPHYMRAIQAATEEEKAQLTHIRELKERLAQYNN